MMIETTLSSTMVRHRKDELDILAVFLLEEVGHCCSCLPPAGSPQTPAQRPHLDSLEVRGHYFSPVALSTPKDYNLLQVSY